MSKINNNHTFWHGYKLQRLEAEAVHAVPDQTMYLRVYPAWCALSSYMQWQNVSGHIWMYLDISECIWTYIEVLGGRCVQLRSKWGNDSIQTSSIPCPAGEKTVSSLIRFM